MASCFDVQFPQVLNLPCQSLASESEAFGNCQWLRSLAIENDATLLGIPGV